MPRVCSICSHPKRDKIEQALRDKVSLRDISGQFGTSRSTLQRHQQHMIEGYAALLPVDPNRPRPPDPVKLREAAQSALGEIIDLKRRALAALDKAEALDNNPAAVLWFKEVRSTLELLVKTRIAESWQAEERGLSGDLADDPRWESLRAKIWHALRRFPKAVGALEEALAGREFPAEEVKAMQFKDISPAVEGLLDNLLSDAGVTGQEVQQQRPVSSLPQEERSGHRPPTRPPVKPYEGAERRNAARVQYKCVAETSWAGLRWFPGQIVDGSRKELPYPPPDDGCWTPFNSIDECPQTDFKAAAKGIKRPAGGLKGIKV